MEGTVKERLVRYLKFKHIGQNRFESMAGISNGYISNLKSAPGANHLTKILNAAPDLSRTWLLSGDGEMIKGSGEDYGSLEFVTENKNQAQFFRDDAGELRISVPHVPYAARAEFANFSDRLEKESESWSREMYQVDKIVHGTYFSFDVKGESMDDGSRESLQDGDKVLVRELERDFWKDIRTGDHRYWVIVFGSSVLIKEIVSEDTTDGTIVCHSLNPSPEYSDFTLNLDEVRYLFYVIKIKPRERTA